MGDARGDGAATAGLTLVQEKLVCDTTRLGRGLHELTEQLTEFVGRAGLQAGLLTVFVRHTSCSLAIQENADPTARADLLAWLDRLAPADDPRYLHTAEGSDDMPAHLKAAVTRTSETIPVIDGRLGLGTWQGLFLCEHRQRGGRRELVLTLIGR